MTTVTPQEAPFYYWFYEFGGVNPERQQTTMTWTITPTTFDWGTSSNLTIHGTIGSIAATPPGKFALMPTFGGVWFRTSDKSTQSIGTFDLSGNPWIIGPLTADNIGYVQIQLPDSAVYTPGPGWQYTYVNSVIFMADNVHGDTAEITGETIQRTIAKMRLDVSPDGGSPADGGGP